MSVEITTRRSKKAHVLYIFMQKIYLYGGKNSLWHKYKGRTAVFQIKILGEALVGRKCLLFNLNERLLLIAGLFV